MVKPTLRHSFNATSRAQQPIVHKSCKVTFHRAPYCVVASRTNSLLLIPLKLRKQQPLFLRSIVLTVIHHPLTMSRPDSRRVRHRMNTLRYVDGLNTYPTECTPPVSLILSQTNPLVLQMTFNPSKPTSVPCRTSHAAGQRPGSLSQYSD